MAEHEPDIFLIFLKLLATLILASINKTLSYQALEGS